MKYLVTFSPCVSVEAPDEDRAVDMAIQKILANPDEYIIADNCQDVNEDTPAPEAEEPTIVVFRRWKSTDPESDLCSIIALFPEIAEGKYNCSSYEHVGQHGAASYNNVIAMSTPATPEEYADLKKELEGPPYNYKFDVRKRYTRQR